MISVRRAARRCAGKRSEPVAASAILRVDFLQRYEHVVECDRWMRHRPAQMMQR
jgi:hypothetical protein